MNEFRLLMISAMYENGGNVTHRLFDGHPQLFVYPFESQLGTHLVQDHLTSMFPVKYRWPIFAMETTSQGDYKAIIDEECKVRARTPQVSKFRHMAFDFNDDERCDLFRQYINATGRSRAHNVAAFFRATFDAWKNYKRTGEEVRYMGYSPIIIVDADKIAEDFPDAHVLHVVRNPWSAFADTKKRPVPLSLKRYMTAWTTTQYHALVFRQLYPERIHIVRYEDIIAAPQDTLGAICETIGIALSDTLSAPTWNGTLLEEVYPWGTIRRATPETNRITAAELSAEEQEFIRIWASPYLNVFQYEKFISL
jgi:hypothetical protein